MIATDSGIGTEAISLFAVASLADFGTSWENLTTFRPLALLDAGVGSGDLNIIVSVPLTGIEAGIGASFVFTLYSPVITDSGSLAGRSKIISNAGEFVVDNEGNFVFSLIGGEEVLTQINVLASEAGSSTEGLQASINLLLSELNLTTSETTGVVVGVVRADFGAGFDLAGVFANVLIQEAGLGLDRLIAGNIILFSDTGAGREEAFTFSLVDVIDTAVGEDLVFFVERFSFPHREATTLRARGRLGSLGKGATPSVLRVGSDIIRLRALFRGSRLKTRN